MERFVLMRRHREAWEDLERRITALATPGICPGLSRMSRLLRDLEFPQRACPVIHITGTNGKGSTGAVLERIFRSGGYATGFYTSPHLVALGERFLVNGAPLAPEEWSRAFDRVEAAVKKWGSFAPPSYFEVLTALAFLLAEERHLEVLVLEAGMGGRFDATNVAAPVEASVITTIARDHQAYLGNSLEEIGEEKFAVIRRGGLASFRGSTPSVNRGFLRRARLMEAREHLFSQACTLRDVRILPGGSMFVLEEEGYAPEELRVSMRGGHQVENGAHAFSAARRLMPRFPRLTPEALRLGLEQAFWPFRGTLFPGAPPCFVDGVHNPEGARAFAAMVKERWPSPKGKILVFSCMRDKDSGAMLRHLAPCAEAVFCTGVPGLDRAASPEDLWTRARREGWSQGGVFPSPREALEAARKEAELVLVGGSLYLLGQMASEELFGPFPGETEQ